MGLPWRPEHHARLFSELLGQLFQGSPLDNVGHAVLNAGRLKAFFGARCTKDAQFGWKRQKTQVGLAFGQRLYLLDDLHAG